MSCFTGDGKGLAAAGLVAVGAVRSDITLGFRIRGGLLANDRAIVSVTDP